MKKLFTLFIFFILFLTVTNAQSALTWADLADVKIETVNDTENFLTYNQATFGEKIALRDSTEIYLTGYLIPIDAMGLTYALSKNPNASCFFCGGAGPETVVLLRIRPSNFKRYKTDERLTFSGTLRLHENDLKSFIYVLKNAEEY